MNFPPQRAGINRTGFTGYSHSTGVLPQVLARSVIAAPAGGSGSGGNSLHLESQAGALHLVFSLHQLVLGR